MTPAIRGQNSRVYSKLDRELPFQASVVRNSNGVNQRIHSRLIAVKMGGDNSQNPQTTSIIASALNEKITWLMQMRTYRTFAKPVENYRFQCTMRLATVLNVLR
jgi:hypothetical protein